MPPQSKTSSDAREFRRLRAVELYEQGWRPARIAEALDVSRGAVSQWLKIYREEGVDALRKKGAKKPSRLTPEQQDELAAMLSGAPEDFGLAGLVWTRARVAELIEREFGISYHVGHVGKILKRLSEE